MASLKKIWKNRKQIYDGIKNSIIRDQFVEEISKKRMALCNGCSELDIKGTHCEVPGTQPCCMECGCSLDFKTRSLSSSCPKGEWYSLMNEDEEHKLGEL